VDSPLAEPLRHNAWATLRLLEASQALTPEQLAATVPGTFGSVLATLQHIIRSEGFYQFRLSGRWPAWRWPEDQSPDLDMLERAAQQSAAFWETFLSEPYDPDRPVVVPDPRDDKIHDVALGVILTVAVPCNYRQTAEEIAHTVADSGSQSLFGTRELLDTVGAEVAVARTIVIDGAGPASDPDRERRDVDRQHVVAAPLELQPDPPGAAADVEHAPAREPEPPSFHHRPAPNLAEERHADRRATADVDEAVVALDQDYGVAAFEAVQQRAAERVWRLR
jgi:uncharacterized damage-inducible protein DinB